jgi:hypothetical protein
MSLVLAGQVFAMPKEKLFHVQVGLGELYNPNSIRVGHKTWEAGKLNGQSFGIAKQFYKNKFFASFGPAMTRNGGFGFYAGFGIEWPFLNFFTLRPELSATAGVDNYSYGEVLVGLTFYL